MCVSTCSIASVVSDSLRLYGPKLLYPLDSSGKNTGVDCHALLQGIFLTQGLDPHLLHLLHRRQILYHWATRVSPTCCLHAKSLQSCLILCNSKDCSLPGSSVHGVLQGRILEWVAMPSSKGSSWTKDWTRVSCSSCTAGGFFTAKPWGNPHVLLRDYQIDENSL